MTHQSFQKRQKWPKNWRKNSQKKSFWEEIWGKRNRHQRENKKWCLGFFNRFLKNWVSTSLQLNENFRNLGVFLTLIGCCKDLCNWIRGKKKKKNWILGLRFKFWIYFWNLRKNRVWGFFRNFCRFCVFCEIWRIEVSKNAKNGQKI